MTPEERNLVSELFDRLATLESAPRDPDAERLIIDGLRRAPNATYALVQTVLVQDEALKRADARIRALEQELGPAEEPRQGGFLDNMRGALFGRDQPRPGSVPSVPPVRQSDTRWGAPGSPSPGMAGGNPAGPPTSGESMRPGGSFLGTMAASAAGVIGGSLLLDGIRSMMGHQTGGHAAFDPSAGGSGSSSPWSNAGGGQLSRDAGLDDIGRHPGAGDAGGSAGSGDDGNSGGGYGLFDGGGDGADQSDDFDDGMDDGGFDSGGGGDGSD